MVSTVFIDGEHGTTGLQIRDRLAERGDITLISLDHGDRHDVAKRREALNETDIAILCLPDDAAREAVAMAVDAGTRFIDASTAHRTHQDWVFGYAELNTAQADAIRHARYVSNPGCYSTGAIALLAPLVACGLLPADYPVSINAVSGYSGGGKAMIAQMEDQSRDDAIASSHFEYALSLSHKHVPEIIVHAGLSITPIFTPNVGRFAQGMAVNIPLHADVMGTDAMALHTALTANYKGSRFVSVAAMAETQALPRISPEEMAGRNDMVLHVTASPDGQRVNLVALLDNLGKGASGAAVQNLDLMLGL